jgi:hypothetical protein
MDGEDTTEKSDERFLGPMNLSYRLISKEPTSFPGNENHPALFEQLLESILH